ncbi:MAG: Peptide chain release factor 2 [Phycisphaerae bacterium]|nr:Peptide chain release factor 2 [Phycisphaerae bacterium]
MADPGFWNDQESARKVIDELKPLKATIVPVEQLLAQCEDLDVLLDLAVEEEDAGTLGEVAAGLRKLSTQLDRVELMTLLNGPMDSHDCYFSIHAGAGGTESCDWAEMLMRMYLRYFEREGYKVEEIDRSDGEEAGIRSVTLFVKGSYAYGYLSCERGVHRLVRISPFDANKRRHTSFAAVDVVPEIEDIQIEVDWDKDVREDTYRASGAGGQHVNKTSSAIRLTHLPTNIVVQCQSQRSQHQNRATARKMLAARLYQYEQERRDAQLAKLYGDKGEIAWGSQIRSYVLDDRRVKDHRTLEETSDVDAVLDGDIQAYIDSQLRHRASKR